MRRVISLLIIGWLACGNVLANGEDMFDESFVHEIRITFEEDNFWEILTVNYDAASSEPLGTPKVYLQGKVSVDGTLIDSVGVRQKGFFSNWGSPGIKKPIKIDFNEFVSGQKYDGLKKLNLQNGFQDPTFMRDALAYKFIIDAGGIAPRTSYVKLYLNDTYWGLYIAVEQIDEKFLKDRYENENGNIYKCVDNTRLHWQGPSKAAYKDEFGLKTNKDLDSWTEFIDLVDKINDDSDFEDSIATQLQMNNYLRVLAADVLMLNWDSYYNHGRNFYMYYDSTANAFQWIPWDYNLAFSLTPTNIVLDHGSGDEERPLIKNVMNSDKYRELYFNHLCVLNENYFTLANLETYINTTRDLIYDAVNEDPNKFYSTANFTDAIEGPVTVTQDWGGGDVVDLDIAGLKTFITQRNTLVASQLASQGHNCTALSIEEEEQNSTAHVIFPNPSTSGWFTIKFSEPVDQLTIYAVYGTQVFSETVTNQSQYKLDLSGFAAGMYIVELEGENKTQMRIVRQ